MATLRVTAAALAHIRGVISAEQMEKPVVVVGWSKGHADLHRGAAGEALWEHEPPGWFASIVDLAEVEVWDAPVFELHGLQFSFFSTPGGPSIEGRLLGVREGKLVVNEDAI